MWTRGFIVLWIAMLVAMAGIGMVSPLLPIYVRDDLGGPEIAVALSFSGLALAQLVASPFVGRLGDYIGTKPFIVTGFLIYCLGAVGYLFADNWQLVIAFRMITGFGAASVFPMTLAYIGRLAPPGREGAFMGTFSVSQILGFGVGPLLGGTIRDAFGSENAFLTMAIMLGATGLATLLFLPPDRMESDTSESQSEQRLPLMQVVKLPLVQAAISIQLLIALGFGASFSFLAIFVISEEGLGTGSAMFVGILFGARSIIGAIMQPIAGRAADRYNRVVLVVTAFSISALGQFFIPSVPRDLVETSFFGTALVIAPWLLALMIGVGLAEAFAMPASQAIFVSVGRSVGMGSVMGLNQMGGSIGFLSGSLIGAVVVSNFGIDGVFRYAGIVSFLGAFVFLLLMRRAAAELRAAESLPAPEASPGIARS
ncbi:MAG: MFS transporter [Dehalococcoidia bacterium]|jgi:MFS transporter, DHA1 family, multidrug resistance protein|nr:MFS transporter [Dehalococcoidia bacterium]